MRPVGRAAMAKLPPRARRVREFRRTADSWFAGSSAFQNAGPPMAVPPTSGIRLSVVMITMNEEKAVERVIGEIRAVAPEAEILLVDSSKDRTAEKAQALGARVIKQFPPKGYGP